MKSFVDPAAEFVPTCERVFGRSVRVLDGSRAVLIDDVKLQFEAGERELWLVDVRPIGLEHYRARIEVHGDIEGAVREAKELLDG